MGVAQCDGAAVRAGGGVLGLAELGEEPVDLGGLEGLIDLDCGVARDAGGDAATAGFGVFGLLVAVGNGEDFFEHVFELCTFETCGRGFDREGAGAKGFGFEAVAVELFGDLGEGDHLGGEKIDEEWHE